MVARTLLEVEPEIDYERETREYQASLPPEHYMESTAQATQRFLTVDSFHSLKRLRSDVHLFNELAVLYLRVPPRKVKPVGKVVPDNMVVIHEGPIVAEGSYVIPHQPAAPFLVLEYVSSSNRRKDYVDNRKIYEKELKVPYYLLFDPERQEAILHRLEAGKYVRERTKGSKRLAIPELDLEAAIRDDWLRFWYGGELLQTVEEVADEKDEIIREKDRLLKEYSRLAREKDEALVAEAANNKLLTERLRAHGVSVD